MNANGPGLPPELDRILDAALGQSPESLSLLSSPEDPRVAAVRGRIQTLLDDGQAPEPPRDLTARTLTFVREARLPATVPFDPAPGRNQFRWADLGVAAAVFLASIATIVPGIGNSQRTMGVMQCGFNLQSLGQSLNLFASSKGAYPAPPAGCRDPAAGVYAAVLHKEGYLDDFHQLDCPSNGPNPIASAPPIAKLCNYKPNSGVDPFLSKNDYTYNPGHFSDNRIHPLCPKDDGYIPVMADCPNCDKQGTVHSGNSANHRFRGQNVLYTGGQVKFLTNRSHGKDDIYLNRDGKPSPARDASDVILLPPSAPMSRYPDGIITGTTEPPR